MVAPSCGAQRTFARAAELGADRLLVADLPSLRELHADLDDAAATHPGCAFLSNYRAPQTAIQTQEQERVLATHAAVRGRFASRIHRRSGLTSERLLRWPVRLNDAPRPRERARTGRVLLAGLASARAGAAEALALVESTPDLTLLVRPGEGTEPRQLLEHPQVRPSTPQERATLDGVELVIAPSWCEANPPELARAVSARIPVVATTRAAGHWDPDEIGAGVARGDSAALCAAVDRLRAPGRSRHDD